MIIGWEVHTTKITINHLQPFRIDLTFIEPEHLKLQMMLI